MGGLFVLQQDYSVMSHSVTQHYFPLKYFITAREETLFFMKSAAEGTMDLRGVGMTEQFLGN